MTHLTIRKKNEVYITIHSNEEYVHRELADYFTFEVPEAKFLKRNPRYKYWDGTIRLYSPATGDLYHGLLDHLQVWAAEKQYIVEYEKNDWYGDISVDNNLVSLPAVKNYMKKISKIEPRDYQYNAVYEAIKNDRKLLLSPTGSGKSLMIYSIVRYYTATAKKILIIVPTTSLVEQMVNDFISYGWNADDFVHKIYSGKDKNTEKPIIISTWQSIYKFPKRYFDDIDCVIGDEAHLFKSKSLTGIMTKLHNAKYRFGFTGTLDGSKTHKWVLEGLFGKCEQVTKTDDLIKGGYLSKFRIKILLCKHAPQYFETYQDEIEYLVEHKGRNNLIKNLVKDIDGNTLVLFNYVEKHGTPLYELINSNVDSSRKVFFVHGGTDVEDREEVRKLTESESNAIIVASYGTFSTGINIKRLHNIIFASPSKSRIRNLQSIGRVLRKGEGKDIATLYDIADDIGGQNYTLKHLNERVNIYNTENFKYEVIRVNLRAN
jgi:superfamily II DNA or RNA helicase|tara:strand:+ start:5661 stop:7124 length:1464 start_codon:yes stop_codon:yes gene_type:complete